MKILLFKGTYGTLMIICLTLSSLGSSAYSADLYDFETERQFKYNLSENLYASGSAWIIRSKNDIALGSWLDEKISFEDEGAFADISIVKVNKGSEVVDMIRMNPLHRAKRRIQFKKVAAGSKLVFSYAIEVTRQQKEHSYINLSLSMGKHKLKHIRIPVENASESEEINLGILSFWNREATLILEVTMDSVERPLFYFNSKVEV